MNPEKVEYHFIKSVCWLFQVVRNNNMFWDLRWQSWPSESVGKGRRLGSCLRIKEPDLTEDWDIFYKMTTPSGGLLVTWPFPITFLSVLPSCFTKNSSHSLSPGVIASRWGAIQRGAWLWALFFLPGIFWAGDLSRAGQCGRVTGDEASNTAPTMEEWICKCVPE